MAYVYIGIGLLLLFGGAELLVRGAVGLARALGVSPLVIGLVVISLSTAAPEFIIALRATLDAKPDLAVGNIIGSNLSNLLFILGIGAIIRPLPTSPKVVLRDGGALVLASIAFLAMAWDGAIGFRDGLILVAGLIGFLVMSFATDWRKASAHSAFAARAARTVLHDERGPNPGLAFIQIVLGGVLLYFGATYVIGSAIFIARSFGMPEAVVGLTAVAVGTSLPELITTVVATARGETDLAVGNLVGSSIINLLAVTGIVALIHPIENFRLSLAHEDAVIMVGATLVLIPALITGWKISRFEGLILFLAYGAYIVFLAWRQGVLAI